MGGDTAELSCLLYALFLCLSVRGSMATKLHMYGLDTVKYVMAYNRLSPTPSITLGLS